MHGCLNAYICMEAAILISRNFGTWALTLSGCLPGILCATRSSMYIWISHDPNIALIALIALLHTLLQ